MSVFRFTFVVQTFIRQRNVKLALMLNGLFQGVKAVNVEKFQGAAHQTAPDVLAVEEPLEIQLEYGPEQHRLRKSLSITMRTPGADEDLARGFLFTEGIVKQAADVLSVRISGLNTVLASLHPELEFSLEKLDRHFYTSSSCGVCGKSSMDAVKTIVAPAESMPDAGFRIRPEVVYRLPGLLRAAQSNFEVTGGLHASALFDPDGGLIALREDVGRHNALDKLIGHLMEKGVMPLDRHILLLSGRASFELLQKAAMAGIRFVCAVGAPSSLAVETAESFGITLVGFLRDNRFNVYSGAGALELSAPQS